MAACDVVGSVVGGGGLFVNALAEPTVEDCIITGNSGDYGGGVSLSGCGGTYEGCRIIDNEATSIGGGLYVSASLSMDIRECEIVSNSAQRAGGVRFSGNGPVMTDCLIARNEATSNHSGGVWLQAGSAVGCTIVDNESPLYGGNVTCLAGTGTLTNCIIAFSGSGDGIYAEEAQLPTMSCCDVWGNSGDDYGGALSDQTGINGNIMEDPQLCGMDVENYTLYNTSPCMPGGNDCGVQIGCHNQGCMSPVEERSWGTIKAMYR